MDKEMLPGVLACLLIIAATWVILSEGDRVHKTKPTASFDTSKLYITIDDIDRWDSMYVIDTAPVFGNDHVGSYYLKEGVDSLIQ